MKCFVPAEEDLVMQLWLQDPASVIPFSRPLYSDLATPSQPPPSQGEELKTTPSQPPPSQGGGVKTNQFPTFSQVRG